ncbi:MAG: hypothetical protein ABI920_18530 [Casimicrobiaceae bacterium]
MVRAPARPCNDAARFGPARPVILAGDCNVVSRDADVYNPFPWRFDAVMQSQARAALGALIAQGWTDATRHRQPDERIYTFWVNAAAFRRMPASAWICLLLAPTRVPRRVATAVDAVFRGRERASDHAPV